MANPNRKMATVRRIDKVMPIEGADRIELAIIGGWQVVVGKGEYGPGDMCVYYEPDTFLPADDDRYASFAERGTKEMLSDGKTVRGSVLRTIRLRGVWSQGLCMKPADVMPEGIPPYRIREMCESCMDVSGLVNVWEYTSMIPMSSNFKGRYDVRVAPRTGCERVQNVDQHTFDLLKRTDYWTSVKADGTSTTMVCDGGEMRFFSHNYEFSVAEPGIGKVLHDTAEAQGLIEWCQNHPRITLQAELCGHKIAGNPLGIDGYRLYVFSVWDMDAREYVSPFELRDSGAKRVLDCMTPFLDAKFGPKASIDFGGHFLDGIQAPDELLEYADGMRSWVTRNRLDEGLVVHAYYKGGLTDEEWVELGNALGPTYQMKAVSRKFLANKRG